MPVRIVQSKQNARLKELRRALANPAARRPRRHRRPQSGRGSNPREGSPPLRLRVDGAGSGSSTSGHCLPEPRSCFFPETCSVSTLATETPQPVAALVDPPQWTWEQVLGSDSDQPPLVIVLAGLQDPGNLGTILRSAEAFGATGIVSLPGTVSPWNPKAVRASAGSVFRVPLVTADPPDAFARLRAAGIEVLVAAAGAAPPADRIRLAHPVALLIGNEGNGVPNEIAELADGAIQIPCPGPVESLNAAVAASVLLYEASRQRASAAGSPARGRGGIE